MALVACPECTRELSDKAAACPHCGAPVASQPAAQVCGRCGTRLVAMEKAAKVSGGGIFGALLFLIGLGVMFGNALVGIGLMILAILIGTFGRTKHLVMVCPRCGASG